MIKQMAGGSENDRRKQEAGLDEALEQTFPASDPFLCRPVHGHGAAVAARGSEGA